MEMAGQDCVELNILGQISGRQIDGNALIRREFQPAILDRGTHPFARLLHLDVGQPDQREARQAIGKML
jgi:hypothetical protein